MELLYSFTISMLDSVIELEGICPGGKVEDVLDTTSNDSNTSLLPYNPLSANSFQNRYSMGSEVLAILSQGDGPLWNLSSKGGTILRVLLNRAFEEVEMCAGSMVDYSDMAEILDNATNK